MRIFNPLRVLFPAFVLAAGVVAHAQPAQPAQSQDADDIRRAQDDGKRLYEAMQHDNEPTPEFGKLANDAVHDLCKFKYRTLWVDRGDIGSVYLIAEPKGKEIVAGRDYRVDIDKQSMVVKSVTPSTVSCIVLDAPEVPAGAQVVGAGMTHLLSRTPTEFHVFLSQQSGQPLFISTKGGLWSVDKGQISTVKQ